MVLYDWLFPLNIMRSGFICERTCISGSFLFMAEYYSIMWIDAIDFIHASIHEHLVSIFWI